MLISLFMMSVAGILGYALSELPWPDKSDLDSRMPRICFAPTEQTVQLANDQMITCVWTHPGQYPPQEAYLNPWTNQCCFWDSRQEPGIFWAIGESVMSRVTEIGIQQETLEKNQVFELHQAELMDIQTVDAATDEPVKHARITMADAAVHFVSFSRLTDEDGYAVLPVIPGIPNVITIRADRYLAVQPFKLVYAKPELSTENDAVQELQAHIVELDPGIEIRGNVSDPNGNRMEGARIHIEIERSDIAGAVWSSELDLSRAVEAFATSLGGWVPVRSSYSTSPEGIFAIQTLPRGKMSIFASHAAYMPSERVFVDTSDAAQISPIRLKLKPPKRAYIRVEDEHQIAVPSAVTVIDDATGHEIGVWKTSASGAIELNLLPERARFQVVSDTHAFLQQTYDVTDNAEITLVLTSLSQQNPKIRVLDNQHLPIERATVSISDSELQKKYPLCMGKTDKQGFVQLESCPADFWISIFHPDYAHAMVPFVKTQVEIPIQLQTGHEMHIEMVEEKTQNPVTGVACTLITVYQNQTSQQKQIENIAVNGNQLVLHHRPEYLHQLKCTSPSNAVQTVEFMPASAPQKLVFPYRVSRQILVMDAFSSPVPYARIEVDGRTLETDETGQATLSASPQTQIKVMHWLHGHTEVTWTEGHNQLEIRLPDTPPEFIVPCLKKHHIEPVIDSAAILINHDIPEFGLKRADAVEFCHRQTLTIVRDGRRMQLKLP